MIRGYVPLLAIVAAIWGASYLFIKVAVDEVEPTAMMFFRLVLASAVLVPVLVWRLGASRGGRGRCGHRAGGRSPSAS